ncbi:MAG TPA: cysteine synthase family protein [Myxococcota bacterium]|nr:cysteine synthase family protein [Myxococcota bacterium]
MEGVGVHPFDGADGLLAHVGDTPLVRIRAAVEGMIPDGVEIWGKCEWFNPGGSVKDRAALAMVLDAERRGVLRPGDTLLDSSSGNTGISYAMIAAARGYRLRLCLPRNANEERKALLAMYGTEVVLTDPLDGSDGAIREARRMAAEDPSLVYLDQYSNPANWRAHYGSTGPEIWRQTGGRVTHFVSALGTSGTFMGTSLYMRDHHPQVACVEVQPDSPMHGLEGLKHMDTAIVPAIYDAGLASRRVEAPTDEAFEIARRMARLDGLLVGPSAAAAVWACTQVAQGLDRGVIVTILCDSGARYLSERHIWGLT